VNDRLTQKVMGSHGPDDPARNWATTFEAVRKGETNCVSVDVERLLPRKPEESKETIGRLASA